MIGNWCVNRETFAYEKLKKKRENKQGCYLLRQSCTDYNEYYLDVCLEDNQPATTFFIEKSDSNNWKFKNFSTQTYSSIQELLINHHPITSEIPGFELKECIPPSENGLFSINSIVMYPFYILDCSLKHPDVSDLLLCRQDRVVSEDRDEQHVSLQLPVCIHPKDILLYLGIGVTAAQFSGRFTSVDRGVWNRKNQDQLPVVRKMLKPEYCVSHSQVACYWGTYTPSTSTKLLIAGISRIGAKIDVLEV